jgi:hypothetical protein
MKSGLSFLFLLLFSYQKGDERLTFHKFQEMGETLTVGKMNSSYNYILYIGKDTTLYDINGDKNTVPYEYFYQRSFNAKGVDTLADKIENVPLRVLIDTLSSVQIPFYPDIPKDIPGAQISEWAEKSRRMVTAYPVYIWNPTTKITSIPVQGVATEIIQEAKDKNGNWRPIEYWVSGFCANGVWEYILKPNYYVVTSIYKYSGEFKTDLRIKFRRGGKIYYSNSFRGSINRGQFALNEDFKRPDKFLEGE